MNRRHRKELVRRIRAGKSAVRPALVKANGIWLLGGEGARGRLVLLELHEHKTQASVQRRAGRLGLGRCRKAAA